jgi:hypothetical protein
MEECKLGVPLIQVWRKIWKDERVHYSTKGLVGLDWQGAR